MASMSSITLTVSLGEALDKYSILMLKKELITDVARLAEVNKELQTILPFVSEILMRHHYHYTSLYIINKSIWELTDKIIERSSDNLIQLYDEVFLKNAARFRVKSKINTLEASTLKEQKSYSSNSIVLKYEPGIEAFKKIRYASLCYDIVRVQTLDMSIKSMFANEPFVIIEEASTNEAITLSDMPFIIPNLYEKYDTNITNTRNYICGGRLGDLIHCLYVIMAFHKISGVSGNLYITDDLKWGGDGFSCPLEQTFNELYTIVSKQSYISKFAIYKNENIDVNLNDFRKSHSLYNDSWCNIMSKMFAVPLLSGPWIDMSTNTDYTDTILIHRSVHIQRQLSSLLQLLIPIAKENKCYFIGTKEEYEQFPLKALVSWKNLPTLMEKYVAINSCKLFIGNQSSPLAMAYSLNKPCLAELTEGQFYNKDVYPTFNWISNQGRHLPTLTTNKFYGQFLTDKYIAEYFPEYYMGTCLDIGMAEPITNNNSYHFEELGWNCLCVDPNPLYFTMSHNVRKNVENIACGKEDGDDIEFEIYTINGSNQSAISSLKTDNRLVENHKHLIDKVDKIKVNVLSIDTLLSKHPEITKIDFLSIDTEDTELDVLKGFDINRWKPKLFVIENNFDEPFIGEYLRPFGYVRDKRVEVNDFFIRVD